MCWEDYDIDVDLRLNQFAFQPRSVSAYVCRILTMSGNENYRDKFAMTFVCRLQSAEAFNQQFCPTLVKLYGDTLDENKLALCRAVVLDVHAHVDVDELHPEAVETFRTLVKMVAPAFVSVRLKGPDLPLPTALLRILGEHYVGDAEYRKLKVKLPKPAEGHRPGEVRGLGSVLADFRKGAGPCRLVLEAKSARLADLRGVAAANEVRLRNCEMPARALLDVASKEERDNAVSPGSPPSKRAKTDDSLQDSELHHSEFVLDDWRGWDADPPTTDDELARVVDAIESEKFKYDLVFCGSEQGVRSEEEVRLRQRLHGWKI